MLLPVNVSEREAYKTGEVQMELEMEMERERERETRRGNVKMEPAAGGHVLL